jgi:hypothetical protein
LGDIGSDKIDAKERRDHSVVPLPKSEEPLSALLEDTTLVNRKFMMSDPGLFSEKANENENGVNVTPTLGSYHHHHMLPECVLTANRSDAHSTLLGYALDGFPIYGPYGYTTWNDKTSGVKKLKSNYRTFAYVGGNRTVFGNTNTSIANASYYGPSTSTLYQLSTFSTNTTSLTSGAFIEDFYFDSSSSAGDLNEFNKSCTSHARVSERYFLLHIHG